MSATYTSESLSKKLTQHAETLEFDANVSIAKLKYIGDDLVDIYANHGALVQDDVEVKMSSVNNQWTFYWLHACRVGGLYEDEYFVFKQLDQELTQARKTLEASQGRA